MFRRQRTRTDSGRFTPSFTTISESSENTETENEKHDSVLTYSKKYHRSEPCSPLFNHRKTKTNSVNSSSFSSESRNSVTSTSSIDGIVFKNPVAPPSLVITQSYEDTTKDQQTKQHLITLPKLKNTVIEGLEFQVTFIGFDQVKAKVFDENGNLICQTEKSELDWDFTTRRCCYKKISMISCTKMVVNEEESVLDLWLPNRS